MLSYFNTFWKPPTKNSEEQRNKFLKVCIKKYRLNKKNEKAIIIQKWYLNKIRNNLILIDTKYLIKLRSLYFEKISKIDHLLSVGNLKINKLSKSNELGLTFRAAVNFIRWKLRKCNMKEQKNRSNLATMRIKLKLKNN